MYKVGIDGYWETGIYKEGGICKDSGYRGSKKRVVRKDQV